MAGVITLFLSHLFPNDAPILVLVTGVVAPLGQRWVAPQPRPEQCEDVAGPLEVSILLLSIDLRKRLGLDRRNGELMEKWGR